jgi:hypothetical protein
MHLHAHAPANFVFAGLLADGTITRICTGSNKSAAAQQLLHLLTHIFLRLPLPAGVDVNPHAADPNCRNDVVLAPLSDVMQAKLTAHDTSAMGLMSHALRVFARTSLPEHCTTLPASGASLPPVGTPATGAVAALAAASLPALVRSPLATLAGQTDAISNASDVLLATRQEILFNSTDDLPLLEMRDLRGRRLALNSYAMDFYKNGNKDALMQYNNLLPHNVWHALKEWSDLLNQILEAVNMMMPDTEDEDAIYKTFSFLADKFKERMREMNAVTTKTAASTNAGTSFTSN